MRIWDIDPKFLCRKHLLGEHRELHAVWAILTKNKKGYRNHPETKRWEGKLAALFSRHEKILKEMKRRGYREMTALDKKLAKGKTRQDAFINTKPEQIKILREKKCHCFGRFDR